MNGKIKNAWEKVNCFCATQSLSFYVGMVLAVLLLLSLRAYVPLALNMGLSFLLTPVLYLLMRATKEHPKTWKGNVEIRKGVLACGLGNLWSILLTLL